MSAQTKQVAFYGSGISMGERPRAVPAPFVIGEMAIVNAAAGAGAITIGTEVTQATVSAVNANVGAGTIIVGHSITQNIVGVVQANGVSGAVITGTALAQASPAAVNAVGISGGVSTGGDLSQVGAAVVHTQGGAGIVLLEPLTITQDDPATVNARGGPGAITLTSGAVNVTQAMPAIAHANARPAAIAESKARIVQHEPAKVNLRVNAGAAGYLLNQVSSAVIHVQSASGGIAQQGLVTQVSVPSVRVNGRPGGVVVGLQVASSGVSVANVAGVAGSIAVGQEASQGSPASVRANARTGAVAVGYAASQAAPAIVHAELGDSQISMVVPDPITILQVGPAVVNAGAGIGLTGLGGTAACRWFAPNSCLRGAVNATKILRKAPDEVLWVAYNFRNQLIGDEEIATVLTIDDGGANVIGSPGIIQFGEEVKWEAYNGTDLQNVRVQHRVLTSEGRQLEGDGYLYIRGRL